MQEIITQIITQFKLKTAFHNETATIYRDRKVLFWLHINYEQETIINPFDTNRTFYLSDPKVFDQIRRSIKRTLGYR